MMIEIDEEIRRQATAVFATMGLSETEAITLFYKRTIACGRMPFGEGEETPKRKKKRMNERFAEWDAF